ncbi:hypothetical protein [Methylobacterium dankookense]|uniref:Uncharacterized protein n=2 Tax=Methylobacterium dankookense TaxID=560405 RepID=A0A564G2K6_9HYPH|nr:hypothetical protein [Methylobacterium dankookense]GJD54763.1 hypothetical protein IFDJLNFL_0642 [Methylobacterium dankookense]VUF14236.1 hypothetical protein MTDSW087_03954 [Methylobacterium dankookense]
MIVRLFTGAALGLVLSTGAFAQSFTAPSGIPAAVAPGGLDGVAAPHNLRRYEASGHRFVIMPADAVTTGSTAPGRPLPTR